MVKLISRGGNELVLYTALCPDKGDLRVGNMRLYRIRYRYCGIDVSAGAPAGHKYSHCKSPLMIWLNN